VFAKILIANRGEIACRVMRTARRLGVRCVAVHSHADRDALHVALADAALEVPDYLDIDGIVDAARRAGAEAIHPGYGFLAENEDFAQACRKAGIVFIGPSPEAIAAMGDKAPAKALMAKAGVPLVPGFHGEAQDTATLEKEAARIGYPLLIKPSAGGGGKGMRIVSKPISFAEALEASKREAKSAFGDDRVLLERYLERARHIEMQVFGDTRGNVVHLFERDCSVQRRHQKVLEEAPAPHFAKRGEMASAAIAAAKAIGYVGAGTVEFIAAPDGSFYFMEMNTRLQVEHPVTEMVTGLDLVEWQLRVAAGEALPLKQDEISITGHAIEARIYAEDPERDFLPATGRIAHLVFPEESASTRVDTGVAPGAEITPWYDPMIAKLVVHGADRDAALARLRYALAGVEVAGVTTNVRFLRRVVASRPFAAAELDTGLIERHRAELLAPAPPAPPEVLAAAALAELGEEERAARARAAPSGDPHSPWNLVDGWRLNEESHHDFVLDEGETSHRVRVLFADAATRVEVDGKVVRPAKARTVRTPGAWHVFSGGEPWQLVLKDDLHRLDLDAQGGSLAAPMPGKVVQVLAQPGAGVKKGDPLMILEAMKMEHTITAPADGVVKEVHYAAGDQVLEGVELIAFEAAG
jgi:3-methylcrotonyl-CoA carboxylase alpha subunit